MEGSVRSIAGLDGRQEAQKGTGPSPTSPAKAGRSSGTHAGPLVARQVPRRKGSREEECLGGRKVAAVAAVAAVAVAAAAAAAVAAVAAQFIGLSSDFHRT